MKENAPEKIYIACDVVTEEGRDFILEHPVSYLKTVEYIRTDAFIEKACEWIKKMWSETDDRFKEDYTGMLIEDFKNHMKG